MLGGGLLEAHSAIQIVLLPIGNIPHGLMRKYENLIKSFSKIPKQNFTRPGDYVSGSSPFRSFSWNNGDLHFNFCGADMDTEWGDFQVCFSIPVYLCVCAGVEGWGEYL